MSEAAQILDTKPAQAPQENMGEGPAKDVHPQPSKDEHISSKLEVLIGREQRALAEQRRAKQMLEEAQARIRSLEERESRVNEFETKKKNPKEALSLLGLSYDELTQAQLNDGELPPQVLVKQLREEIEALKQGIKHEKDTEKEQAMETAKRQAEAEEQKTINQFKTEINTYLDENKDRYELIKFEDAQALVYDVIDEHFNRTLTKAQKAYELGEITEDQVVGKVMPMKEAADKVEEHLEQKYNKAKELSKTKALWGTLPKPVQEKLVKQEQKPNAPPKTLTNQLSATPQSPRKDSKLITDAERIQKALAYARERGIRA